jgi:prevent-host-death family protein
MQYVEKIGVRELRRNINKYLRRVAAGESFLVTERGKPLAVLDPPQSPTSLLDEMVASGELIPPENPGGILSTDPLPPLELGFSASEVLQRMRDEERY